MYWITRDCSVFCLVLVLCLIILGPSSVQFTWSIVLLFLRLFCPLLDFSVPVITGVPIKPHLMSARATFSLVLQGYYFSSCLDRADFFNVDLKLVV